MLLGAGGLVIAGVAIGRGCSTDPVRVPVVDPSILAAKNKEIARLTEDKRGLEGIVDGLRRTLRLRETPSPMVVQGSVETPIRGADVTDLEDALARARGDVAVERLRFQDFAPYVFPYDLAYFFRVSRDSVEVVTVNPLLSVGTGGHFNRVYRWPKRSETFEVLGIWPVRSEGSLGWRANFERSVIEYEGLWARARFDLMNGPSFLLSVDIRFMGLVNIEPFLSSVPGVGVDVRMRL